MSTTVRLAPFNLPQIKAITDHDDMELLTPDEVRALDNRYAILFIRGAKPVMDLKYELTEHPAIRYTIDGGGPPYIHHQKKPETWLSGAALFAPEADQETEECEHEPSEKR